MVSRDSNCGKGRVQIASKRKGGKKEKTATGREIGKGNGKRESSEKGPEKRNKKAERTGKRRTHSKRERRRRMMEREMERRRGQTKERETEGGEKGKKGTTRSNRQWREAERELER